MTASERRSGHGFEDTRWRTVLLTVGVLASMSVPLWQGAIAGGLGAAVSVTPATGTAGEPLLAGLETSAWVGIVEREGLAGARDRLEAMDLADGPGVGPRDVSGLLRAARDATARGRTTTATELALLAVTAAPSELAAYTVLSDACATAGDAACVARAERTLARVVARRGR